MAPRGISKSSVDVSTTPLVIISDISPLTIGSKEVLQCTWWLLPKKRDVVSFVDMGLGGMVLAVEGHSKCNCPSLESTITSRAAKKCIDSIHP